MNPFEPLWLRILRVVSIAVLLFWCWAWVMDEDYREFYRPLDPVRASIELIKR